MSLGTFLVLLGLILAVVACFAGVGRDRRYSGYVLPAAVILVALGVLVGASPLIEG